MLPVNISQINIPTNDATKSKETGLRNIFLNLAQQMPELIEQMKDDLSKPEFMVIREFFILPNDRVPFNPDEKRYLCYYEEQHENLMHKVKLLENHGFVYDITPNNAPKYRMTEEFVDCVVTEKINKDRSKL